MESMVLLELAIGADSTRNLRSEPYEEKMVGFSRQGEPILVLFVRGEYAHRTSCRLLSSFQKLAATGMIRGF